MRASSSGGGNYIENPVRLSRRGFSGLGGNLVVIAVLFLMLLAVAPSEAASPPDFRLKGLDGKWFSLKDHLGSEVIYIDFWATWCVPCRRELPHLQEMFEELGEKGFLVISINTDPPSNRSKIKPFVRRYHLGFPTLLDPDNRVLDQFNPTRELPYGVLIGKDGNVVRVFSGYRSGDEAQLREAVLRLLETESTDQDAPKKP